VPGEVVSSLSIERTSSCAAKRKSSSALSLGIIEALSFSVLFSSSLSTPSAVVILLTVTLRFRTLLFSAFGPASYPKFVTRVCSSSQFGIYEISGKSVKLRVGWRSTDWRVSQAESDFPRPMPGFRPGLRPISANLRGRDQDGCWWLEKSVPQRPGESSPVRSAGLAFLKRYPSRTRTGRSTNGGSR
jgi:hypothetical protein